jgi:hypothetical protein
VAIGDKTWALREIVEYETLDDSVYSDIYWAHGSFLANVWSYADEGEQPDWRDMEDIALAIDALLP